MHVFLETARLILRRFTEDDVDLIVELDGDPEVMRYLSGGPATPREEIEQDYLPHWLSYYDRYEALGFWAAIEKDTGDFIGWFHFRPNGDDPPEQPELGYRLRRAVWRKGYGTEGSRALIDKGFSELGVERVIASTYQDNLGSRRVMEKSGMRLVRTFRFTPEELLEYGITNPDAFPGDEVEYAITRAEWETQREAASSPAAGGSGSARTHP